MDSHRLVGGLTALVAVLTLPVGLLVALFVGLQSAAVVFIVGWLLLTPLIPIVGEEILPQLTSAVGSDDAETDTTADSTTEGAADALERLKARYANGEIDEAEFERRVERLVAVEDLDLAADADPDAVDPETFDPDAVDWDGGDPDAVDWDGSDPDRELERERE